MYQLSCGSMEASTTEAGDHLMRACRYSH